MFLVTYNQYLLFAILPDAYLGLAFSDQTPSFIIALILSIKILSLFNIIIPYQIRINMTESHPQFLIEVHLHLRHITHIRY